MNILWINKITDREYWRTTQLELSKSLRKRGNKVTLIMARNFGEKKTMEKDDIIYLPTLSHFLLSGLFFGLALVFYLFLVIHKEKIDVIIIDGTSVWLPFVLPLKLFNIPLVLDVRDLPVEKNSSLFFSISLHIGRYFVDELTTITPELEEILRKRYHLSDKKIGIWPSGVSMERFGYSNQPLNTKGLNKFTLLYHGSYGKGRGIENLILAIGKLKKEVREKVRLLLVGIPVEDQGRFLRLCERVGVKKHVEILPVVEHEKIPYYIHLSDVGVIPLPPDKVWWRVSVPLKTLEYLAMGKPVIATSIPFHRRLFEKGECGVIIDTNSPEALADAITYLYRNKEKLRVMGKTGREIVEKNYTWDDAAFKLEGFLKRVLYGDHSENR
ncbi:MAG TPA: glycosyltransferase WbuB [Thermoplasmatales archaeon]|nr:glycosyltransferase WbuB [Thermoplasmatales archaeon]